jgi:hypothetical protein
MEDAIEKRVTALLLIKALLWRYGYKPEEYAQDKRLQRWIQRKAAAIRRTNDTLHRNVLERAKTALTF